MTLKIRSILQILAFSLFFLIGFSLFGQSVTAFQASEIQRNRSSGEDTFYVSPIRGDGSREDKSWFYDRLVYELVFQRYSVSSRRSASDYTIRGTLDNEEGFLIELIRNRTNEILLEKQMFYTIINESTALEISVIIYDMLNNIPESGRKDRRARTEDEDDESEEPEEEAQRERTERVRSEDWRDKVFFFEYSLIWAPREKINDEIKNPPGNFFSNADFSNFNYLNLGLNFALEMQILNFFAMDVGVQITQETSWGNDNRDLLAEFFISLKLVLKPFNNFMIEPYGGIAINQFSIIGSVTPSTYSYFGGLELCIKTKSGIFVIDPRLAFDLYTSNIGSGMDHKRRMPQLGIGYKTGFITKLVEKRDLRV